MEKLGKDQLFLLAIELDFPQLLKFCESSKRINDLLCQKDNIWIYKLDKEFPDYRNSGIAGSYKKIYETLFIKSLETIKRTFKLKYNLDKIYNLKTIIFRNNEIKEIPKEIRQLSNLEELYLGINNISKIPKEIGELHNLRELRLSENKISEIPKEIGKLSNLEQLWLSNNRIKEIPKEIGMLNKLRDLNLSYNNISKIPKEIGQLHNLEELNLNWNMNKIKIPEEIGQLQNLQELKLLGSQIEEIPDFINPNTKVYI